MRIGFMSTDMPIPVILGDGWQSIFDYGNIHEIVCNSTLSKILLMTIYETSNWMPRCGYMCQLPCCTEYNPDHYSRDQIKCWTAEITLPITLPNTHQQKIKWHSQYSEHFEIQVHLFSIMQCTLAGNILSKIVFISLGDFQTWYSIPKEV